ncbi:DUF2188 domain-containing protein [Jeotgalibacillus soli]|uniref:DUF2188 domain-containing protein n=1 Tax=Jeotgalibacillus soli TaxID=889306 RepID=UPI000596DB3B|nr:DUF2188 domain-containing protein [Jeotgalibacillus soli]
MPWSQKDYPHSWKNLDKHVRDKAIEIGNALIEEQGYEEGRAIAIATEQAKKTVNLSSNRPIFHITTHVNGWQLKKEGQDRAVFVENTKQSLADKAKPHVTKQNGVLVIHREDDTIEQTLYES